MTTRRRLPNRRASETFAFEVNGLKYTCTVSWFSNGSIGELFLKNHKVSSGADISSRDAAIVFSIAVQHNADQEAIRRALSRDANGAASGPLATALDILLAEQRGGR